MTKSSKKLGDWGEQFAVQFLVEKGVQILAHNIRTAYGEIDILGCVSNCLLFIEVKTRSGREFGYPEESITVEKKKHMIDSANAYLQEHSDWQGDWRIDIISILKLRSDTQPEIQWFENAVQEN